MCRIKSCVKGFIRDRIWIYFLLQTLVNGFLSFWLNFGIGWVSYDAGKITEHRLSDLLGAEVGTNFTHTHQLWKFPLPLGGDLLITIIIQTFLTFVLLCFFVTLDVKRGPEWCMCGIKVPGQKLPSKCCRGPYEFFRPYGIKDWGFYGCKGILMGLGRAVLQIILWLILIGGPATIITCVKYLPDYTFSGVQCAVGKAIYGLLVAIIQTPFFVWLAMINNPKTETDHV